MFPLGYIEIMHFSAGVLLRQCALGISYLEAHDVPLSPIDDVNFNHPVKVLPSFSTV